MFERNLTILGVTVDDYDIEGNKGQYANLTAISSVNQDSSSPKVGATIATYKIFGSDNKTDIDLAMRFKNAVVNAKTLPVTLPVVLSECVSQGKPIIAITALKS